MDGAGSVQDRFELPDSWGAGRLTTGPASPLLQIAMPKAAKGFEPRLGDWWRFQGLSLGWRIQRFSCFERWKRSQTLWDLAVRRLRLVGLPAFCSVQVILSSFNVSWLTHTLTTLSL